MGLIGELKRKIKYGGTSHLCTVCGANLRRFYPFGTDVVRPEAQCPLCHSLERHRLIWHYFKEKTDLFDGREKTMLHFAPELCLTGRLRALPGMRYWSADLGGRRAMIHLDITKIPFSDKSVNVVYCSHVLEHVLEDVKAMKEIRRVLKDDGWAILQVPIKRKTTFEDPAVTDPKERERIFGQDDHVRIYGTDYVDRLREAGFQVTVDPCVRELGEKKIRYFGLEDHEDIYFCRP